MRPFDKHYRDIGRHNRLTLVGPRDRGGLQLEHRRRMMLELLRPTYPPGETG